MARPTKYDDDYPEELIEHMTEGFSFESFAGKIGTCKQTLYNWLVDKDEFLDAKNIGTEASRLFWEQKGMDGLWGDKDKKFNNAVWIFSMKNRFGWRDRQDVVITPSGADKDPEDMDDDELMGEVNRALKVVEHARKSGAKKSSSSSKGSKNKTAKKATKKKANKKSKKKSS